MDQKYIWTLNLETLPRKVTVRHLLQIVKQYTEESTIKRAQKRRQVFINKMKPAENTASDTRCLNPGSNQLNADTHALPGTSSSNRSQQHLELTEFHSNPDNMDRSHNDVETMF